MNHKVIAIQTGARHNYAIPRVLYEAGILKAFYTDLCADAGIAGFIKKYCPKKIQRGALQNLLNRRIPKDISGKLHTFDKIALAYQLSLISSKDTCIKKQRKLFNFEQNFGKAAIKKGLQGATHAIAVYGDEGSLFLKYAKQNGARTLSDIIIHPDAHKIMQQEQKQYPNIEEPIPDEIIDYQQLRLQRVIESTDTFLVPSQFVADGLMAKGVLESSCKLLPYTVSEDWFNVENNPVKGRILFVGTAGLRKGIHILGIAANKLKSKNYEFRIAGGVSQTVRNHALTRNLNFLGQVPRSNIKREYSTADIFVLPSLAEGSATVIYEALASGLPIIATKSSGSFVRDGIEGFIIPCRNSNALADRIEELTEDRSLRKRMSNAARERAKDFTLESYSSKLVSYIQ